MNINFNKNEDFNKILISDLRKRFAKVKLGGGQERLDKQREKGKMTARERVDYLLDNKTKSIEIGAFAGGDMYDEHGGCPSGGVIVKIGYIYKKNVFRLFYNQLDTHQIIKSKVKKKRICEKNKLLRCFFVRRKHFLISFNSFLNLITWGFFV